MTEDREPPTTMALSRIDRDKLNEMRERLGYVEGQPWSWMNELISRVAASSTNVDGVWILPENTSVSVRARVMAFLNTL